MSRSHSVNRSVTFYISHIVLLFNCFVFVLILIVHFYLSSVVLSGTMCVLLYLCLVKCMYVEKKVCKATFL